MKKGAAPKQNSIAMITKDLTRQYSDFFQAFPFALPQKYTWAITGLKIAGAVNKKEAFYFDLFLHKDLVASTIIHPDEIDGSAIEYISTFACNYKNPRLGEYLQQLISS